jgi:hypothetical protein
VVVTLVSEIFFLNKALALFNTAMVTPTYYVGQLPLFCCNRLNGPSQVIFTFCVIVTSAVSQAGSDQRQDFNAAVCIDTLSRFQGQRSNSKFIV